MHVSNAILLLIFFYFFTIAYIYNVVLYTLTASLSSNVLHFSISKNIVSQNNFPLQSKFYARNCPIATYLKNIKYIFYCLNLNTDLDPGLDEEIHYKSNYYQ